MRLLRVDMLLLPAVGGVEVLNTTAARAHSAEGQGPWIFEEFDHGHSEPNSLPLHLGKRISEINQFCGASSAGATGISSTAWRLARWLRQRPMLQGRSQVD